MTRAFRGVLLTGAVLFMLALTLASDPHPAPRPRRRALRRFVLPAVPAGGERWN